MHFQYVSPIHITRIQIFYKLKQIIGMYKKVSRDGLRLHKRKKHVKPV
jgi:hypothetical protein